MADVELASELTRLGYAKTVNVATKAQGDKADTAIQQAALDSAIATRATTAQGAKADTAIQQAALDAAIATRATTAQGAKADTALQPADIGDRVPTLDEGVIPSTQLPNSIGTALQPSAIGTTVAGLTAGKVPTSQLPTTDGITEGTTNRFFSAALVRAVTVATLTLTNAAVIVGDTYEAAIGKIQAQINAIKTNVTTALKAKLEVACGDETTAITTGTKVTLHVAEPMTITEVFGGLSTVQATGTLFAFDVKKNGTTIFTTKPTIDNTEETTLTAATPAVLNGTVTVVKGDKLTFSVDVVGDGTAKGLKVYILGTR